MKLQTIILKNISIVSFSTGITSVIGLLMIPFLINHLGPMEYASFMIFNLFLVAGYAGLLFLGLPLTVIKLTAEYYEEDLNKCNQFFSTILIFTFIYSLLISSLAFSFFSTIVELLSSKISQPSQNISSILIIIFASYPIFFLQLFLDSILEGLQKYSFLKSYKLILALFNSLGIILIIINKYSIFEIFLLQSFLALISNVLIFFYLNKVSINFVKCKIYKPFLNGTLKLSSTNFLSQISSTIFHESDRLLIAIFLPTIYFTYYEIATKIPRALKLIISFSSILLPLSCQLNSKSDTHKLQLLFYSGSKLTYFIVFPFSSSLIYLGEDILTLWVGKEYAFLSGPFNDMVIWSLLTIIISIGTNIVAGTIKSFKPIMYYSWSITLFKILISLSLVSYYDLRALTYAYLYSNLITFPILVFFLYKFLQIDLNYFYCLFKLPIIFFSSCLFCNLFFLNVVTTGFLILFFKAFIFIIIILIQLFFLFLNRFERDFIKELLKKIIIN
jgi:O-antigen/teichoic acid export membrane protein